MTSTRQKSEIRQRLEALVGVGNVSVTLDKSTDGADSQGFFIRFLGSDTPSEFAASAYTTAANGSLLDGVTKVSATGSTISKSASATGTIQLLDLYDENLNGAYTLEFDALGSTFTTSDIAFDASADEVRSALLGAKNSNLDDFTALGGDASVRMVLSEQNHQMWEVTFGGVMLGRQVSVMQGLITQIEVAPEATLSKINSGATTSEVQRLALPSGQDYFALSFGSATTAPIAANVTVSELQTALEKLSTINRGNVAVTSSENGVFDVSFVNELADSYVSLLKLSEVQLLDLRLPDGLADLVMLRAVGNLQWQGGEIDLATGDTRAALASKLGSLTDDEGAIIYGVGNIAVYATSTNGVYHIVGTGANAGTNIVDVVAGLKRNVDSAPDYLLIGATDVNGMVGGPLAGIALSDLSLGMVISRTIDQQATSGYALKAEGSVALSGMGDDVRLSATGSIAANTLGRSIAIDVPAGLNGSTYNLSFPDGKDRRELIVDEGTLEVAGLGSLSGGLAMNVLYHEVKGIDTTDIRIGLKDVTGSLAAGGLSANLADGQGAILLRNQQGIGSRYAVQAEGDVSFEVSDAVQISAEHLQIAWNRWGAALSETVITPDGFYELNLINDEARLRGYMGIDIAGVVSAEGELFIEVLRDQNLLLSDSKRVNADQVIIGGANALGGIGAGNVTGAAFDDFDVLVVLSTEISSADPRRWVSVVADVGSATVGGYELTQVEQASLSLNQSLSSSNGVAADADAAVIDWSSNVLLRSLTADIADDRVIDFENETFDISAKAGLSFGPAYLGGVFTVSRNSSENRWEIKAQEASIGMSVGDVAVSLSEVDGTLYLGDDGSRSGTLTGDASLTGIDAMSLEGTLAASFDGDGNLTVGGNALLDVSGMAEIQGDFVIQRSVQDNRSMLAVGIANFNAAFEVGSIGSAGLQDGNALILMGTAASGASGYAITGTALAVIDTPIMDTAGDIKIVGNTLGRVVERAQKVGDITLEIAHAEAYKDASIDLSNLDVIISDGDLLYSAVNTVSDSISGLKTAITPVYDTSGTNTNMNPMAVELPVIGSSLSQMVGADKLLSIGDYIQRYIGNEADFASLTAPVYGATGQPSLKGMLGYLQDNWLLELGIAKEALQLITTDEGVRITFADIFEIDSEVTLRFDEAVEDYYLSIDGEVTANIGVALDVAFDIAIDWAAGDFDFNLHRLNFDAQAQIDDIDLTASLGPLAVSIGDVDRETGSLILALSGRVEQTTSGLSVVKTRDEFKLDLPVYAELGSLDLAAGKTPRLIAEGNPFGGNVSWSTQNFDSIGDFSNLSVIDLITMFPDFLETLDEIQESEIFANGLPFLDAGLDQVLAFGEGFKSDVYDKIDFYRPRVDLLSVGQVGVAIANVDGAEKYVLTNPQGGLTEGFVTDKQITLYGYEAGVEVEIGTYSIDALLNDRTLTLRNATGLQGNYSMVLHDPREQIQTLQEFMEAVNRSGVLPAGLQITFDPVERSFGIPLAFSYDLNPFDIPLNLDLGSDAVSFTTDARGSMAVHVAGTIGFFADLDGKTHLGEKGSIAEGTNLFSDDTFIFETSMVGYQLELAGEKYEIVGYRGDHLVALDRKVSDTIENVGYVLREGSFSLGMENVSLTAGASLDVTDLEVGIQLGMLKATAGGKGTGSGLHVGANVAVTLDRNPNENIKGDTRFAFGELSASDLNFDLSGDGFAKLRGLSIDPGLGSDIPLAPNIEVSLTALDLFNPGDFRIIEQNPMYAADVDELIRLGQVSENDMVVILPDLGAMFDFKDLSFGDIVSATRTGLEMVRDTIEDQPFYTVVLPVVSRSLEDVFPFVDQFLEKLEDASNNPAGAIGEVEAIIESALGIQDDDSLPAEDQSFALALNGDTLDIHLNLGAVFNENFGFSLDLQQLASIAGPDALAGFDFIDDIADVINPGAAGQINLSALVNFRVQAGVKLTDNGPEFFLYDYNPTRVSTKSIAAFGGVNFANRSSTLADDAKQQILSDFQSTVSTQGEGVIGISAVVDSYWMAGTENSESQLNIDATHGTGQLSGRRMSAIVDIADWLSTELGVKVTLFAGDQVELTEGEAHTAFNDVKVEQEYAVTADKARGTYANLGLRIAGQDLYLGFEAGPAKIGVSDGWAAIDGDGIVETEDYATFTVKIDQKSGRLADDGKFYFGSERLSDNLSYALDGAIGMNLPLALSVSGLPDISLSGFKITTGDAGLQGLLDMAAGRPIEGTAIIVEVPNVQGVMDQFLGEFSLLGMLTDPSMLLDGVDTALGVVQDTLSDELARDLPFIGDKMGNVGTFVRDVRVGFLQDLREKLSSEGGTVGIMRNSLWDLFGQSGLNIIMDRDGSNTVNIDDIGVYWVDREGLSLGDWVMGDLPPSAADGIEFDLDMGMDLVDVAVDIPLDINIPGFSLDIDGGFSFDMGWAWDFGFGISTSSGFYLKTNTDDTAELRVTANALLKGENGNPFAASGSLLFFGADIVDDLPNGEQSGVRAILGLDVNGDERGRLPVTKLFSQSPSQTFDIEFGVDTEVNFKMTLEVPDVDAMPKLRANMIIDWDWNYGSKVAKPVIDIVDLRLDVGSLVNDSYYQRLSVLRAFYRHLNLSSEP